jgi:2-methylcitrate dehydratase PrpD
MTDIAFKPYACGTMTQPFIDCAIRLAAEVAAEDIVQIVCQVAEGTVHRLWEPLSSKHGPPSGYAAKFSTPFCMAVGFLDGKAGLEQFTEARVRDPQVLALASKIRYEINPADEYPRNFSGHLRVSLADGTTREIRQPHMRGGSREPLSTAELEAKFMDNAGYGGWTREQSERFVRWSRDLFRLNDLESIREFRS